MCSLLAICSWKTGDNFNEARATSLPSSTVDLQKTVLLYFKQNFVYANSDSGFLFIMCGLCSPACVVVWYNYHGT